MPSPPPATHRVTTAADGRPVLVKRGEHPGTRSRLRAEAAVLRSLDHPGVVRVRDLADADGATALHLEWVGPHSLATVAGVPAVEAALLVARAADVVADLHRAGISHGRLTPDHVLLAADGRPVLTGLAGARSVDDQPPADDVAALGALLCELVQPLDDGPAVPETRRSRPRHAGLRAALLTLADQAGADDPGARPDARGLAERLRVAAGTGGRRTHRARADRADRSDRAGVPPRPDAPGRTATAGRAGPPHGPGRARLVRRPSALPRPAPRHVRAAVGLAVAVAGTVAAATWVRPDRTGPSPAAAAPTTTAPPGSAAPPVASDPPPVGPDARPPAGPPPADLPPGGPEARGDGGCPAVSGPVLADVDADGCPDAVTIAGERVTAGGTTWVAGRPGDVVAVADWDCDGWATPASVRPSTGEVFVFDRWAVADEEVTVEVAATVPGAAAVRAVDADGDGCPDLVVERRDGAPVEVEVGA